MESNQNITESFDEKQSMKVIHDMIQTAKQRHNQNGILFIVWGWIMLIITFWSYFSQTMVTTVSMTNVARILTPALYLGGLGFTIYYLIKRNRKVKTYISKTLLFVWIGMFGLMIINSIIHWNYVNDMITDSNVPFFTIQHLVQMMIVGFATFVTGLILNQRLIIFGGILFALLAVPASWLGLSDSFLLDMVGWLLAFIIPGHIIYAKRNK